MSINELLGWISAASLALCGLPQALASYAKKSSFGINKIFLSLWFLGEVTGLFYVAHKGDYPLMTNYGLNTLFVGIIVYYAFNDEGSSDTKDQGI